MIATLTSMMILCVKTEKKKQKQFYLISWIGLKGAGSAVSALSAQAGKGDPGMNNLYKLISRV